MGPNIVIILSLDEFANFSSLLGFSRGLAYFSLIRSFYNFWLISGLFKGYKWLGKHFFVGGLDCPLFYWASLASWMRPLIVGKSFLFYLPLPNRKLLFFILSDPETDSIPKQFIIFAFLFELPLPFYPSNTLNFELFEQMELFLSSIGLASPLFSNLGRLTSFSFRLKCGILYWFLS